MKQRMLTMLAAAAMTVGVSAAASKTASLPANDAELGERVAHEIRMYDRYTIWDNVNLKVKDGAVELVGQVSQPYKKDDLGRIVKRVPGVETVTNELKVLPLSPNDDRIRVQVARAIYGDSTLSRYGMGALPSIHVIVDNGHVTLEGVVANDMDKQIAGMRASGASLSFGPVVNNLRVENSSSRKG